MAFSLELDLQLQRNIEKTKKLSDGHAVKGKLEKQKDGSAGTSHGWRAFQRSDALRTHQDIKKKLIGKEPRISVGMDGYQLTKDRMHIFAFDCRNAVCEKTNRPNTAVLAEVACRMAVYTTSSFIRISCYGVTPRRKSSTYRYVF